MTGAESLRLARAALRYARLDQVRRELRDRRAAAIAAGGLRRPVGTGDFRQSSVIVLGDSAAFIDRDYQRVARACAGAKRTMLAIARRIIRDGAAGEPLQVDALLGSAAR